MKYPQKRGSRFSCFLNNRASGEAVSGEIPLLSVGLYSTWLRIELRYHKNPVLSTMLI
jgi:hypothetical protein